MSNENNPNADDPTLELEPLTEELAEAILACRQRDTLPCPPPVEDTEMSFNLELDPDEDEVLVA